MSGTRLFYKKMKDSHKQVRPEVLSIDADANNSWEARSLFSILTLKKIFIMIITWALAILGTGFLVYVIYSIVLTSRMACQRDEPGESVNCVEQTFYLSLIPLNEREIRDVRSAEVRVYITESYTEIYNVDLITGAGNFELNAISSADYQSKRMVADKINSFIISGVDNPLEVDDHGILTRGDLVNFGLRILAPILVVCLFLGLSTLWKAIKSVFSR